MNAKEGFHNKLKRLIIEYILFGYQILKKFPRDEIFIMTAQCKRAMISVFLNYIEGYARGRKKTMKYLYEVSYGSLHESIGVFLLATHLEYISKDEYLKLFQQKEEIGKMLWKSISGLNDDINN